MTSAMRAWQGADVAKRSGCGGRQKMRMQASDEKQTVAFAGCLVLADLCSITMQASFPAPAAAVRWTLNGDRQADEFALAPSAELTFPLLSTLDNRLPSPPYPHSPLGGRL